MIPLPGSGNSIVDAHEQAERDEERARKIMDCGCKMGDCKCDGEY